LAYDEEFLTAALLHDVGKAIDPTDHVGAGLEALDGFITERTAWIIEHHMLAHQLTDGNFRRTARRRLEQSEHFDDLVLLESVIELDGSRESKRPSWKRRSIIARIGADVWLDASELNNIPIIDLAV